MVDVYGIVHIKPKLKDLVSELEERTFVKDSYIFFEPKKELIKKPEFASSKPLREFINGFTDYAKKKKVSIIPLNTCIMPSHIAGMFKLKDANYRRLGMQLAEEEYMADVIVKQQKNKKFSFLDFVVIGGAHAPRMTSLLKERGIKARYLNRCPLTPDLIYLQTFRDAALGKIDHYISSTWITAMNESVRDSMFIESAKKKRAGEKVPPLHEIIEENTIFYKVYCKIVGLHMKKINYLDYMIKIDPKIRKYIEEIRINTLEEMNRNEFEQNHPVIRLWE